MAVLSTMLRRLWIPLALLHGLSHLAAALYGHYRNGSDVAGAASSTNPVILAFIQPADNGSKRKAYTCFAGTNRKSKGSKVKKPTVKKKNPIINRGKATITPEQKQEIEELYRAHIAVTDTPSYIEKISLNTHTEESSPYLTLFESEPLTRDDLIGIDQPFGLVPADRYELFKLCGRVCDPLPAISAQSLTPKQFSQRLFRGKCELTRDEFNYNIEYKMRFYAPGYGDIFFMDKVRCWRAWFLFRGHTEGREDLPTYRSIHQIARPKHEYPLSAAMLAVNYEVHRQGIHPAVLDMFWEFFTDNENTITREEVICKLNWIVDRLKKLDQGEGISPDNFYRIFIEPTRRALKNFDKEKFVREQLRKIHEKEIYQKVLSNNKALRHRTKILTSAYLEEIRGMYKVPTPIFFRRYERRRLAGYFNLLADMHDRNARTRELSKEQVDEYRAAKAAVPVKKKKREKKPSKRNKKQGRGVAN